MGGFAVHNIMFISVFVMALIVGPILIPILRSLKFGQTIREDGPQTHLVKTGTPNMGGLIFLIPLLVVGIYYSFVDIKILQLVMVTFGFGFVGFVDDFIKIKRKSKDGLNAKQKMLFLLIVSVIFSYYVVETGNSTKILIPFWGAGQELDLGWLFIPFSVLVLISASNSVNITDGLDGLAAGVTTIVLVFFSVISLSGIGWAHITVFTAALAGGCLGFLVFNMHPAKVFMGDTGSLALGGAVGAVSIVMGMPLILIIVGIIFVIESLSVMIQVTSFKITGKRVFKMAPLHHHFELLGWKEESVVRVFWIITLLACFFGLIALRINPFQSF